MVVETSPQRDRVLIVDDHPVFRDGLRRLLERDTDLEVVAAVGSAGEALEVVRSGVIDLAIIDLVLPASDGVGVTLRIKCVWPNCKVLGLSVHDDPVRVAAMLRAGADGFAVKTQPAADILAAIRSIRTAVRYLSPGIDADQVTRLAAAEDVSPLERLTSREREVYDMLVAGDSNDQIATKLEISRRTVETHRQHVMRKLGVTSVAGLVRLAFKLGT